MTFKKLTVYIYEFFKYILAEDKNMIQDKVRILSADASCLNEDLTVEIVELLPVEDIRLNNEDQETTECSSSFGYSQSEDEGQSCEVESELREGNGAMPSAEDVPTIRRYCFRISEHLDRHSILQM